MNLNEFQTMQHHITSSVAQVDHLTHLQKIVSELRDKIDGMRKESIATGLGSWSIEEDNCLLDDRLIEVIDVLDLLHDDIGYDINEAKEMADVYYRQLQKAIFFPDDDKKPSEVETSPDNNER